MNLKLCCTAICILIVSNLMAQKKPQKLIGRQEQHFSLFWAKFKKAVLANDVNVVYSMVQFPLQDAFANVRGSKSIACNSYDDFIKKYNNIFPTHVVLAIKNNQYKSYQVIDIALSNDAAITQGQYVLEPNAKKHPKYYNYIFSKVNGIYKLIGNGNYL